MNKHLLLNNIHIYDIARDRTSGTQNSNYSNELGYWYDINSNQPLVNNPKRPLPSSKKHDVERGEDQK